MSSFSSSSSPSKAPLTDAPKPGTVSELRKRFDKGKAAQTPVQYKETSKEAVVKGVTGVRPQVASYNLALRGAQVKAQRRATMLGLPQKPATTNKQAADQEVYDLMQFTEEFEDYPWHLAAQFVDDEEAFWCVVFYASLRLYKTS